MIRPNPYAELADRDSDIVKAALTRKCEVCKAKPGEECVNTTVVTQPLAGRVVHFTRTCE